MPVIAISADSVETGQEISQKVAQTLGWEHLGREILPGLAMSQNIPESELIKALDETPGFFGMRSRRKKRLINLIQTACLEKLLDDNLVCFGLGAHLYVRGVSHVIRVRIITGRQSRAEQLSKTENMPVERAAKLLARRDENQKRCSLELFNVDETDPANYDIIINLDTIEPQNAVDLICETAAYPRFQAMNYSRKCLRDKALASRVHQELVERFPEIRIAANDGTVVAQVKSLKREQRRKQKIVREIAEQVPGVDFVEVHIISDYFGQAAESGK